MTEVTLQVNGRRYGGWKTARVTRGIESIAGTFELLVSERWSNQDQPWPISEEDVCEVYLGTTKVLTGWVDVRRRSFSVDSHTVTVSGRDKTGALVDCSVLLQDGKWEFANVDVLALAKKICAPFGIPVTLQSGLVAQAFTIPKKLSIDPGDTAFNSLESICRLAAVLPVSDGNGGLLLTRSGTQRCQTDLIEGKNILAAESVFDFSGRFREYLVLGSNKGTDQVSGANAAGVKASASDLNVRRSDRTLVVRPETAVSAAMAKKRAEWESTVRAARSEAVTVTVQGWTDGTGAPWPINHRVRLQSPSIGVDGELLISEATYELSVDGGSTTQLTLKRPDAFKPEPVIQKASTALWKEIAKGV